MQSYDLRMSKLACFRLIRWALRIFRTSKVYGPSMGLLSRSKTIHRVFSVEQLASVFPTVNWNTIIVGDNLKYSFFSCLDDYWSSRLFWLSRKGLDYEDEIWHCVNQLDLENALFLDIGAHTGYWSICLKLKYPTLDVFAFEPHPLVFDRLEKNISKNAVKVHALPLAIGDQDGSFSFYSQPGIPCSSSLSKKFMLSFSDESELINYSGSVVTLDTFANGISKDYRNVLIKLDVEGTESNVLQKSEQFLRRFKPTLIMEVLSDDQFKKINTFLVEQGYRELLNLRVSDFSSAKTPNYITRPV